MASKPGRAYDNDRLAACLLLVCSYETYGHVFDDLLCGLVKEISIASKPNKHFNAIRQGQSAHTPIDH